MAFLNPLLLFGCAAIAAPIIIHLLARRPVERTVWAAMRFLQETIFGRAAVQQVRSNFALRQVKYETAIPVAG